MMIDTGLSGERDRLDHQRSRIEDILSNRIVSDELDKELRRRLQYINVRMSELSATASMIVQAEQPYLHH